MNAETHPDIGHDDVQLANDLLKGLAKRGASDGAVAINSIRAMSVEVRDAALEAIQQAEESQISVTAYLGDRSATVSTSAFTATELEYKLDEVVHLAREGLPYPFAGLAERELTISGNDDALQLRDPHIPGAEDLREWAIRAERAARNVPGVQSSKSASAQWSSAASLYLTSRDLTKISRTTRFSGGVGVVASDGNTNEVDGSGYSARWIEKLPEPEAIGREAGTWAVAKLGARKIQSQKAPVLFDKRVSASLIAPLLGAIGGHTIAKGNSFLQDKLGQRVCGDAIGIVDDPSIVRALGSRVSDSEGVAATPTAIVQDGVLKTWLLDCLSARELGLRSTGHAGGLSNLTLQGGLMTPEDLMRQARAGLVVTQMFSPSLNASTGDWSVGVGGFWFENGEIAYPVSEITIAGVLPIIYQDMVAANDMPVPQAINCPSILTREMSISGK